MNTAPPIIRLRQLAEQEQDVMEKGVKAFIVYVQTYQEQHPLATYPQHIHCVLQVLMAEENPAETQHHTHVRL